MNNTRRAPEPVIPLIRHDPPAEPEQESDFPIISAELFGRAKNGDAAAFGQIVKLCEGKLFGYTYRILNDVDAAKAIVQEALVRGQEHLTGIRNPIGLYSYMLTTAYRIALNYIRDQNRQRDLLTRHADVFADIGATAPPDETAANREELAMLAEALQELPENYRAILKLAANGLTNEEMAAELDIKAKTARVRLFRARGRLREIMFSRMGLAEDEPYRSTAGSRGA